MAALYTFRELATLADPVAVAGRKAASLIDLVRVGVSVPDGWVLTTAAFRGYLRHNAFEPALEAFLKGVQAHQGDALGLRATLATFRQTLAGGQMPPDLAEALSVHLQAVPDGAWAVRSSCTQEDLAGASFAGVYDSVLNVRGLMAVQQAVVQCWSSLFSETVVSYCAHQRIDLGQASMAVIVQQMVAAEASGVAFSVNPQSGHDTEVVIEACFGLGEALVSGHVTPDQYRHDWWRDVPTARDIQHKRIRVCARPDGTNVTETLSDAQAQAPVLTPDQVAELAHLCLDIQKAHGHPVDVEWVQTGGRFQFVQARPVTAMGFAGVDSAWSNADFKDGGVSSSACSAFMWSLYDFVWEALCERYTTAVGLHPDFRVPAWGRMFFSRPYWNLTAIKAGVKRLPGFVEREFDEGLGVSTHYEGAGHVTPFTASTLLRGLNVLARLKFIIWRSQGRLEAFKRAQTARLAELPRVVAAVSDAELPAFYTRFIREEYFRSEYTYFFHIFTTNNVMTLFRDRFKALNTPASVLDVISGLSDVSHLLLNTDIAAFVRSLRERPEAAAHWQQTAVADLVAAWRSRSLPHGQAPFQALVERHQHRSTRELDITVERFGENPGFIVEAIQQALAQDSARDVHAGMTGQPQRHLQQVEAFLAGLPWHQRAGMRRRVQELRRFLWWREELRDLSTAHYFWVRQLTLRVGALFQSQGIVESPAEIFHLPQDDVLAVLAGTLAPAEARQRRQRHQAYHASFRHFTPPDEIGAQFVPACAEPSQQAGSAQTFRGIACSQGVAEGRVKVIADIHDADRLEQGDILVTRFTDPGWTAKFPLLAAVATETGGLLSHAAVISREYGIPAVLAVKNLTTLLVDGQRVRINGGLGTVEVIHD